MILQVAPEPCPHCGNFAFENDADVLAVPARVWRVRDDGEAGVAVTAQCLCDKLPTGSICVFCAYAQGFPAKLYRSGRRYDEAAIPSHWCVDCGKQVKTVFSRCYDCRVKQAVRR